MEDELFKVPRLGFENDSPIFRDMLQNPSSNVREGNSDETPITLESIKKVDFTALLAAMFPEQVTISIWCLSC